ncbi:MAG: aminotransferase class IV [Phycisphaerae bacterium]|nr:aminotransferase class IV [Phycisphaerae bacterium]
MSENVFLNDGIVDADKACISVKDSGFLYGAGLFETMRANNGKVFAIEDHLDRLASSADKLVINNPFTKESLTKSIYSVLEANNLCDARLRLTLSSGEISIDSPPTPTLLITATKLELYPAEYYTKGIMVVICPFKQNPYDITAGHKTTSYYSRILALNIAKQNRAAEALWFTVTNRLAEGCVSNVFVIKDKKLFTPPLATPVLAGIARKTVCSLAGELDVELEEKELVIDDVLDADEIFITNVIMKVMPVTSIEKHTVGDGKVGDVTGHLQKAFDEQIKKYCGENK